MNYKLLFIYNVINIAGLVVILLDYQNIGTLFDIGFCLCLTQYGMSLLLGKCMLAKISHPETRGTMYAIGGVGDSLGMAFISWVGGYMYKTVSKSSPFVIILVFYSLTSLYIIVNHLRGKLTV